ncbi:pyridoxamine 5'-phosphate oxidase family protein [Streptomyces sp. NPDC050625]|uniref:pyridoxamine 5'-phosphate oxidase family protein n=1 Tax=Streptomyces sp. NPDC050625 TaxID=3154629 RepID=UPI0034407725
MAEITQDMIDIIESSKLMFVATVRPDGTPNVSPKGSVRVLDSGHLIFADIASPQTVANLRNNPAVEVNAVDFLSRRGYRFRGTAQILDPGDEDFEWIAAWLRQTHGEQTPCHHAVKIAVSDTAELLSPGYTVGHIPEPELRQAWIKKYGLTESTESASGPMC